MPYRDDHDRDGFILAKASVIDAGRFMGTFVVRDFNLTAATQSVLSPALYLVSEQLAHPADFVS